MTVYCVQAALSFSTAARRDAVLADMQARISGRSRWGVDQLDAVPDGSVKGATGVRLNNALAALLRFSTRADADDLEARIEAFATGARVPQPGSYIQVHDCGHDVGETDCSAAVMSGRIW